MATIFAANSDGGNLRQQVYSNPDGTILPIGGSIQQLVRTDFSSPTAVTNKFVVSSIPAGMTYTTANGMGTITTGTTLDDEVSIITQASFTLPIRSTIAVNMSQRIVGQTVTLEMISVDPVTGVPDGVSSCAWALDGTSATSGVYSVSTGSMPRLSSAASAIPTTAATTWSVLELEAFADQTWFHGRLLDSAAARSNSYVRDQQIPSSERAYKLRARVTNRQTLSGITAVISGTGGAIRITRAAHGFTTGDNVTVDNLAGLTGITLPWTGTITVVDSSNFELTGTAFAGPWVNTGWATVSRNLGPASSTTVNLNYITIVDYVELNTEITAGRGSNVAGQGLAVQLTGAPTGNAAIQVQGAGSNSTSTAPVPIAVASSTLVVNTTGRAVAPVTSINGAMVAKLFSVPELDWSYVPAAPLTTTTSTPIKAAAGASIRNYLTAIQFLNTSATPTEIQVLDGSTVIWRSYAPAAMSMSDKVVFYTPLKSSANAALNVVCVTAASVYVNAQGYTSS